MIHLFRHFLQNESKNIIPSCLEWNIGSRGNKFIPKKLSLRSNFDLPEGETLGSLQMIFVSIIICRLLWNCKYLKWVSHVCWASPGHKMSCDDNFVKISQFLQFPPKAAPIGDPDFLKIRAGEEGRSHQYYENDTSGQCLLPLLYLFYWLATANFERMRGFWRYFWLTQFFKNMTEGTQEVMMRMPSR